MSDDWEVDEGIARQHSRELNEQIGREHSAELDRQRVASEPWPPKGTRVRVLKSGKDGTLVRFQTKLSHGYWVRLSDEKCVPVWERHEIEVISEHDSSHKKTMD